MAYLVPITITKLEGDQAELTLQNGKTVLWPADQLPDGAQEGRTLQLVSSSDNAKKILNELLKEDGESRT